MGTSRICHSREKICHSRESGNLLFLKGRHIGLPLLAIILILGFIFLCAKWLHFLNTPIVSVNKPVVEIVLEKGSSVKSLAKQLHNQDIIQHPLFFELLVRVKGESHNLQSGEYQIDPGITPIQLLHKLVTGEVILHPFTIVDGWTFHKLIAEVEKNPYLTHTLQGLSDSEIMQHIGRVGEIPEGRFFPDTYKFSRGTKDVDILVTAYNLMQNQLNEAWNFRAGDVPYNCPYKALIVASIIEKEASLASERPIISGIIKRRLEKNMYLQLDPTVIYGLAESYNGKLTVKDLKKKTPFNTYVHKGLPPTPICMPSTNAINAALHPAQGKVLYFVAKGDGSHEFSETLKQHDKAIKKYQLNKKYEK
jgi:UPF0755 protein